MTEYTRAWLNLIAQRDLLYVEVAIAATCCLLWYWLGRNLIGKPIISRIALGLGALAVGLGWAWGVSIAWG